MLSTTLMIQLGRVKGNRMIDMELNNKKLVDRGTRMVMDYTHLPYDKAQEQLLKYGSVKKAVEGITILDDD